MSMRVNARAWLFACGAGAVIMPQFSPLPAWAQPEVTGVAGEPRPATQPLTTGTTMSPADSADTGESLSMLKEVVVTAQKRPEVAQSVPVTISVFNAQTLQAVHVEDLKGLSAVVPGLDFGTVGPTEVPFLRGVGNNSTPPGVEAEVATFVDGVYVAAQSSSIMSLDSISSIEVDKGPQGTLFGRNATGGVIQINTKDPTPTPSGDFTIGYGNYDTAMAKAYVTGALAPSLSGNFAAFLSDQGQGWGTDLATGKSVYYDRSYGFRTKLLSTPSVDTAVLLIGDFSHVKDDLGESASFSPGSYYKPPGSAAVYTSPGFYNTQDNFVSYNANDNAGVSAKVTHKFNFAQFVSITAYRYAGGDVTIDADETPVDFGDSLLVPQETEATQEFQLISPTDSNSPLKWQGGTFIFYDQGRWHPIRRSGADGPNANVPAATNASQITKSIAGYGQATYAIGSDTNLTAGLRYTIDHRSAAGSSCGGPAQENPAIPVCSYYHVNGTGPAGPWTKQYEEPTWRLEADHHFLPSLMTYASYSRGFKSGFFSYTVINSPPVKPEVLDAYEAGLKSEFLNHRLRFNTAFFYYNYRDLQVQQFVDGTFLTVNAAGAKIHGVDFDLDLSPADHLIVAITGEYLSAKYDSFPNGPIYTPLPATTPHPPFGYGGMAEQPGDLSGYDMIYAPRLSLALNPIYDIPTSVGDWVLSASLVYKSRYFFSPDHSGYQDSHTIANVSLKWTNLGGRYDASLWVANLGDVRYYNIVSPAPYGLESVPAAPRTFGFTVGVHF